MASTYWRFAYDEDRLADIVSSGRLEFPRFSQWPVAKNDNIEKVSQKLKVGHYVLLANFDRMRAEGHIAAVGRIMAMKDEDFEMQWRRPATAWRVQPNPQGGVAQWTNECVFKFNAEPANRYRLPSRVDDLFGVPNPLAERTERQSTHRKSRHYRVTPIGSPLPVQALGGEPAPELRVADLIAKTARVTQKDTMRVIVALGAIAAFYGKELVDLIDEIEFDPTRPDADQSQACENAFHALTASNVEDEGVRHWLSILRELQTER